MSVEKINKFAFLINSISDVADECDKRGCYEESEALTGVLEVLSSFATIKQAAKWGGQYRTLKELEKAYRGVISRYKKGLAKAENSADIETLKGKARDSLSEYEVRWISHPEAIDINMGMSDVEQNRLQDLTKQDQQTAFEMQDAAIKLIIDLANQRKAELLEVVDAERSKIEQDLRERWRNMSGYERELELARLSGR